MEYKHQGLTKFASDNQPLTTVNASAPSALYANIQKHPTEKMGTAALVQQERRYLQQLSVMYGSHMAERAVVERSMAAAVGRPGGYNSSMFGLN